MFIVHSFFFVGVVGLWEGGASVVYNSATGTLTDLIEVVVVVVS